jgi:hypothetical protein
VRAESDSPDMRHIIKRAARFSGSQFSLSECAFLSPVKGFEKSAHQEKFQRAPSSTVCPHCAQIFFVFWGVGFGWCCFHLFMGRSRRPLETICHLAAVKCSPLQRCEPVNLIKMVKNLWARPSRAQKHGYPSWKPTRRDGPGEGR